MMRKASCNFQVFVKPAGPVCNLDCVYCYYLKTGKRYPEGASFRMSDNVLEVYIIQHFDASSEPVVRFSWHGGEPTVLGLDYFKKIVAVQKKHCPAEYRFANGIQTNGTLLDDEWCRFLAREHFAVGISLDGPQHLHDRYRVDKGGQKTFERTMRGYRLLQQYRIKNDILCLVNEHNVQHPLQVYRFFKQIRASYVSFIPLVEPQPETHGGVSEHTVPADDWGEFLCAVFDEWKRSDIGRIKVQIFEEAARTAFNQEHSLCIFRKMCGGIPVIEHNGDFYCCDHFVESDFHLGNIRETPLVALLEHPSQKSFGQQKWNTLPRYCLECEVREMCNGECPKNRLIQTPDGESGLNYLCTGYRRFFNHCRPFIDDVAAIWKRQESDCPIPKTEARSQVGRNDPCPCGSGKKYKKCCFSWTAGR